MKKIMFNDKYGLTEAVLDGSKTQTRRIVSQSLIDKYEEWYDDVCSIAMPSGSTIETLRDWLLRKHTRYRVGEVVAVAQSYRDCGGLNEQGLPKWEIIAQSVGAISAGWNNKMFVRADLMPHQIRITDVRVERLQDISDEDCLKEGITDMGAGGSLRYSFTENVKQTTGDTIAFSNNFAAAKEAFAHLIDKVSKKDVWSENPYVFVYDFELVK